MESATQVQILGKTVSLHSFQEKVRLTYSFILSLATSLGEKNLYSNHLYLFIQPLHQRQDVTQSIFKWSTTGLNSVFLLD